MPRAVRAGQTLVVARDNLTGNLLGQHDTKAIGEGDDDLAL